jgi:hypothetical protein
VWFNAAQEEYKKKVETQNTCPLHYCSIQHTPLVNGFLLKMSSASTIATSSAVSAEEHLSVADELYRSLSISPRKKVAGIYGNPEMAKRASDNGLVIKRVSWEDTGRWTDSTVGPNITDQTLEVAGQLMPIIGMANYTDVTADIPIDNFNVTVSTGDESAKLERIPLKSYLQEIGKWSLAPKLQSMLRDRDTHILTSAQCNILPLRDGEVEFNIRLHNYQSISSSSPEEEEHPAVLVIASSTAGTSAQVLDKTGRVLFRSGNSAHNYKVTRSSAFVAERVEQLAKERPDESRDVLESEVRDEALERGCIQVFQVPLKNPHAKINFFEKKGSCYQKAGSAEGNSLFFDESWGETPSSSSSSAVARPPLGIEAGVVQMGSYVGPWTGLPSTANWERDTTLPIRCTVMFYNVSDSDDVSNEVFRQFREKIEAVYLMGSNVGSLVTETTTRPTSVTPSRPVIPKLAIDTIRQKPLAPWLHNTGSSVQFIGAYESDSEDEDDDEVVDGNQCRDKFSLFGCPLGCTSSRHYPDGPEPHPRMAVEKK